MFKKIVGQIFFFFSLFQTHLTKARLPSGPTRTRHVDMGTFLATATCSSWTDSSRRMTSIMMVPRESSPTVTQRWASWCRANDPSSLPREPKWRAELTTEPPGNTDTELTTRSSSHAGSDVIGDVWTSTKASPRNATLVVVVRVHVSGCVSMGCVSMGCATFKYMQCNPCSSLIPSSAIVFLSFSGVFSLFPAAMRWINVRLSKKILLRWLRWLR